MTTRISFDIGTPAQIAEAVALLQKIGGLSVTAAAAPAPPVIDPDDNPAAGMDPMPSPAQAFGQALTPAAAFGAAPTPPTASAPVAAVSAPAPAMNPAPAQSGVEVDTNGLPWNAKIHSESKAKNQDGTWRYRRNTDKALIAQVEAELRAAMGLPAPTAAPAPNVPPVPTPPASPSAAAAPVIPPIPTAPGSVAPAAPSPAPGVPVNDFLGLVERITPLIAAQKLTQDEVKMACGLSGLSDITFLAARPDLVPTVNGHIDNILRGKGL